MSKKVSIVIPSYNEEKNIPLVYSEILKQFKSLNYKLEIIFVNDGSKDGSWDVISEISKKDPGVLGINFSRNFGHASALQAGVEAASGDAVIMMDGDLQHPPSVIPLLIKKWEQGFQSVITIRKETAGVSLFKKITSSLFYKTINSISSLDLRDGEADFRLLDRKVVDSINALPESPKFYRGIVSWIGFKATKVEYKAAERIHGKPSYTFKKMLELARIGFTSFSMKPLKLIIAFGVFLSGLSFLMLLFMAYLKIFVNYNYVSNSVILATIILFVTGISSIFQGIIAIYLIDIYNTSKGRPSFVISDRTDEN